MKIIMGVLVMLLMGVQSSFSECNIKTYNGCSPEQLTQISQSQFLKRNNVRNEKAVNESFSKWEGSKTVNELKEDTVTRSHWETGEDLYNKYNRRGVYVITIKKEKYSIHN